jgi:membrane protein insertase Oxa1/YidC/SpoIIIJ
VTHSIGIATTTFLASIAEILGFTVYKNSKFPVPDYAFVGLALVIMYFYDYIYIKKDRYNSIRLTNNFDSETHSKGVIISWMIVVLCIFLPALIFMYFVPFGDQKSLSIH